MHTHLTIKAIISAFGFWGWLDLFAALLVVFGCAGEWWILLNERPKTSHAVNGGLFWKMLTYLDALIRPTLARLKIAGHKLPEGKAHLLERLFMALVTIGVGLELLSLPFSLYESARVAKEAGKANERAAITESNNLVLRSKVVALELQTEETKTNVAKNAPLNLPIKSMAAQVMVLICATNFVTEAYDHEAAIFGGYMEILNMKGERIAMLGCSEFDDVAFVVNGPWHLPAISARFNWPFSDKPFAELDSFSARKLSTSALDKEMASTRLRVPNFGAHFKICRGSIILTINGSIERRFDAPAYTDEVFPISTNRP